MDTTQADLLRQATRGVVDVPGVRLVVLFGSVARGDARADSDVDIGILGGGFWAQLELGSRLAAHLVAARGLGLPTSQRETFDLLARAGLISPNTAREMGAMASLRNRIARSYGDLDPVRLVREGPGGLGHGTEFLDEISRAVDTAAG